MSKNLEARCKKCRRIGEKLFLKGDRCSTPKCSIVKRNYPPGFHGPKGRGRQSGYGLQLAEKQKAKATYNILERQFRITFEKAKKLKGDLGVNFMRLLETRLDNTVYRAGMASSRRQARELVAHGHFTVNGRKVTIPSFQVKPGDMIAVYKHSQRTKPFADIREKLKKKEGPSWLFIDKNEATVKILHAPKADDLEKGIAPQVIVEYYSR